ALLPRTGTRFPDRSLGAASREPRGRVRLRGSASEGPPPRVRLRGPASEGPPQSRSGTRDRAGSGSGVREPLSAMTKRPSVLPSTLACLSHCFDRLCKFLCWPSQTIWCPAHVILTMILWGPEMAVWSAGTEKLSAATGFGVGVFAVV